MLIVVTVAFIQVCICALSSQAGSPGLMGALGVVGGAAPPTPPTPHKHSVSCASGQEYRSEKSLEELTKLVPPECNW